MQKEKEYIGYIQAVRNEDPLSRQKILASLENRGVKPDLAELEQLIAISDDVKDADL